MVKISICWGEMAIGQSLFDWLEKNPKQTCYLCQCLCVPEGKGSWVFAGTALVVVVWIAMYLTSYNIWPAQWSIFTTLQTSHQFEKCLAWSLQITPVVCNNSRCVGHHVIFLLRLFSDCLWLNVKLKVSYLMCCLVCVVWSVVSWCSRKGFQTVSDSFMPLKYISYLNKWREQLHLTLWPPKKVFSNYFKTLDLFCFVGIMSCVQVLYQSLARPAYAGFYQ